MILTLDNFLSTVDLGKLLFEQLVTLLADIDNLCARHAELRHGGQDLFGDLGSGLILGESIRVVEGVVCAILLVSVPLVGREGAWGLWSCAAAMMMAFEARELAARLGGVPRWRAGSLIARHSTQIQCAQWASEYIPISFVSDMVGN